jgi:hypothetical protein
VYHVIGALQGNVKDLKHCALVCRAWVRPSRRHLLRNPTLHDSSQIGGVCALLDADPTLATVVRTIDAEIATKVLTELAPRLPNLTTLSLIQEGWSHSEAEALRSLRLPASLTKLSLDSCFFESCTPFVVLLASVPALRSLECNYTRCDFSEEDAAAGEALYANPVVLAELTMLEIRDDDMGREAGLALGRLLRPRKLTLDTDNASFINAVLNHSGSFLTDFRVTFRLSGKPPLRIQASRSALTEKAAC